MKAVTYQHQVNLELWADRISKQKSSGLNVEEWCSTNNLSRHKFYYWKRLLKESLLETVTPDIVPISLPCQVDFSNTQLNDVCCTTSETCATLATSETPNTALANTCSATSETRASCTTNKHISAEGFKLSTPDISLEISGALSADDIIGIIKAVHHA